MCAFFWACTSSENPSTFQNSAIRPGANPNEFIRTIDEDGYPAVWLADASGSIGVGIFQPKTGQPVLTLRDDDKDGVFDLLTYASLSQSGEVLVDVHDYGMDGQPDLIVNYQQSTATLYFEGKWLTVEGVGSSDAAVMINGELTPLSEAVSSIRRQAYD